MHHTQPAVASGGVIFPITRGQDGTGGASGVLRRSDGAVGYETLPRSVLHALRNCSETHPNGLALVDVDGREITYAELWDRVQRIAGGLRSEGVSAGDRVALVLSNSAAFVEIFFGIMAAGAIAAPLNTRLSPAELEHILRDCDPARVFRSIDEVPLGDPIWDSSVAGRDLAAIFYTSGTTGGPKGATSSHEALLSVVESVRRTFGLPSHDEGQVTTVAAVPLFHVTGCSGQMIVTLLVGGTVVIQAAPQAAEYLDLVERHRANFLVLVPALYYALVRDPSFSPSRVRSVRWAVYGGAPVSPELVAMIADGFTGAVIANGFGMSETSSLATVIMGDEALQHPDSIGYPVPAMDVGILDADPRSGVGELVVRGQTVTRGYWASDGLRPPETVEGWMRTGDGGRIDADGRIYLVDRLKDMINRGGENVFSVEVESALLAAPGVLDAVVVGIPDARLGERVGAVIVPGPDFEARTVIEHVATNVAAFKVPERLHLRTAALPRNAAGKTLKRELRDGLTDGAWIEVPPAWSRARGAIGNPRAEEAR
ncbi:class I adenylate-forming enzyme family protein [Aeromicrobium sp. Leaf350]|uniref:class I adenylate-forming enzyme family protein n=1 Tax=Aeromicrobium sp. Leaf350 TaxID=2876565 RepID=UPI001E4E016F|nr:AMP-binding protein [Aeromicrobium sp. Leaf350]